MKSEAPIITIYISKFHIPFSGYNPPIINLNKPEVRMGIKHKVDKRCYSTTTIKKYVSRPLNPLDNTEVSMFSAISSYIDNNK